nr:hypothetical protein Iba_chr13aCG5010 [Ipomoea batatas]
MLNLVAGWTSFFEFTAITASLLGSRSRHDIRLSGCMEALRAIANSMSSKAGGAVAGRTGTWGLKGNAE